MTRLTFLGTGTSQGVPMIACDCEVCRSDDPRDKRLRTSAMIETQGRRLVIDAGPDFRTQMLRESVHRIDAILLTHEHKDHIGGIDDVRAFNYFSHASVEICCTARVARAVRKDYDYAFAEHKYPGTPDILLREIDPALPFHVAGVEVIPVRGRHYRLPVTGYRIGSLAYLTDFNGLEAGELEKLRGLDVLVVNALRWEEHISHFTVPQALELIARLRPRAAYLTHLSHQAGRYAAVCGMLPEGVQLACDGMRVEIA